MATNAMRFVLTNFFVDSPRCVTTPMAKGNRTFLLLHSSRTSGGHVLSKERCGALLSVSRTRNPGSTYVPDLGAEVVQVMLLPDATSHAPYVQHITDDRRATCHRSSEATV